MAAEGGSQGEASEQEESEQEESERDVPLRPSKKARTLTHLDEEEEALANAFEPLPGRATVQDSEDEQEEPAAEDSPSEEDEGMANMDEDVEEERLNDGLRDNGVCFIFFLCIDLLKVILCYSRSPC